MLMQLTPRARLVGAFIPTLPGRAGALLGFVLELSTAPEEMQFCNSPNAALLPSGGQLAELLSGCIASYLQVQ